MDRHTLIITEKPTAAKHIAIALDKDHKPKKHTHENIPYFIALTKDNKQLTITPALGHLYAVTQKRPKTTNYPTFHFEWAPRYQVEKKAQHTKIWIQTIHKLAQNADEYIDACDYDIEGSLIGYNILHYALDKAHKAKRMKYSTLTTADIQHAYKHVASSLNFSQIEAAKARHEIDWLYGINLSRALTNAAKKVTRTYTSLSTGRVQGPTLNFLTKRESAITTHVPTPYWTIKAQIQIHNKTYEAQYQKEKIETRNEANTILQSCQEKTGTTTNIQQKLYSQPPPAPFDLGSLQTEAYHHFGYSPKQTVNIAEHLYLETLISYPRTSSQKLPPTINYKAILKRLNKEPAYQELTSELLEHKQKKPREGKKEDPAHPAIHPTDNTPQRKLTMQEHKLWDLVVKRFMATFAEPATKQTTEAEITVNSHRFYLSGQRTLKEGWIRFYKPYSHLEESFLPDLKEGEKVKVNRIILEDKFTKPQPYFNLSSLLKRMEKEEIGTKATRADIIQTLQNRKYIAEKNIKVTQLGQSVTEILQKYAPTIISVKLTRELENKMQHIQNDQEKREDILAETIERLKPILEELKSQERMIGQMLGKAVIDSKLQERMIDDCPVCKTGKLVVRISRKTGKRFVGCTNYFKTGCKTTFPLPQLGTVKSSGKTCKTCGQPIVAIFRKSRRPWYLCLNQNCPEKSWRKESNAM